MGGILRVNVRDWSFIYLFIFWSRPNLEVEISISDTTFIETTEQLAQISVKQALSVYVLMQCYIYMYKESDRGLLRLKPNDVNMCTSGFAACPEYSPVMWSAPVMANTVFMEVSSRYCWQAENCMPHKCIRATIKTLCPQTCTCMSLLCVLIYLVAL